MGGEKINSLSTSSFVAASRGGMGLLNAISRLSPGEGAVPFCVEGRTWDTGGLRHHSSNVTLHRHVFVAEGSTGWTTGT
jgi:hypothetical protein